MNSQSDAYFKIIEYLSQNGIVNKVSITKILDIYYPSYNYDLLSLITKHQDIIYLMDKMSSNGHIEYHTIDVIENDLLQNSTILASITKEGLLFYSTISLNQSVIDGNKNTMRNAIITLIVATVAVIISALPYIKKTYDYFTKSHANTQQIEQQKQNIQLQQLQKKQLQLMKKLHQ